MSERYPIFLDLRHKRVLIAGGGHLALQKLRTLEPTGSGVTVVAPVLRGDWPAEGNGYAWVRRGFEPADLAGASLVFAATDDADTNHCIVAQARERGILANAVDDTAWCDFYTPAVVRRGHVAFAVSTDGGFPGLTRALRETLDAWLPAADDVLMEGLFALRQVIRESLCDPRERTAALRTLIAEFKYRYLSPRLLPEAPTRSAPIGADATPGQRGPAA